MTKVIYFAPYANPHGVGEPWVSYQLLKQMCARVDATVLTYATDPEVLKAHLPEAEVVGWQEPRLFKNLGRINWMLKPGFFNFLSRAKQWCRSRLASGSSWDLAHHLSPISIRFPTPAVVFTDCPIVVGPVGGGLIAPETLRQRTREPWYVRLRRLDGIRQKYDPLLRESYQRADLVLGVAPYVREMLPTSFCGRFETFSEWGFDNVNERKPSGQRSDSVRFLAVTRFVPSKGVMELVEAFSVIAQTTSATLEFVGSGPQESEVRKLVEEKNLAGRVTFHGRVAREQVNTFYASSDVFILPSYREASGGVFLEAMSWGLPVICLDYGGPGTNVPRDAGWKIPVGERREIIRGLATGMKELAASRELRESCGEQGRRHVAENFLWPAKADRLETIYEKLLKAANPGRQPIASGSALS